MTERKQMKVGMQVEAYRIGDYMGTHYRSLGPAYKKMNQVIRDYRQNFDDAGIVLVATEDTNDLDLIKTQWSRGIAHFVPEAAEVAKLIPESV